MSGRVGRCSADCPGVVGRVFLIATALISLGACIPVSPEAAARQCEERARAASGITGEFGVGVSNEGPVLADWEFGLTSDAIYGRDPYEVYDTCVREKSGQGPIRLPDLEP